jgi:hypothetical protein
LRTVQACSAQGVPPLTRDGFQFDARPDSPDSDTLIDLPLQDRESVRGADLPVSRDDLLFQERQSFSSRRGFGAGMLVIGLVAGFGGGFLVGQRLALPSPRPSAAEVPRPAPQPPVLPAQDFTEASVVEPPPRVEVQEPDIQPPVSRGVDSPVGRTLSGPPGEPAAGSPPRAPARRSAVARPTLPVELGTLQIASRPSGALVFVDEVRVGTTPMTMNDVKPGQHRVRIELPGHLPWTTSVNVEAGAEARVGASLE